MSCSNYWVKDERKDLMDLGRLEALILLLAIPLIILIDSYYKLRGIKK